jgi:hypothetical protein
MTDQPTNQPIKPFDMDDLRILLQARLVGAAVKGSEMFKHANDIDILAITLMGEGRGESLDGRAAIAYTAKNRAATKGQSVADRCLQRLQYSCWWNAGGAYNYRFTLDLAERIFKTREGVDEAHRKSYIECKYIAAGVISGQIRDKTKGATHYCTTELMHSMPPRWAVNEMPTATIGAHVFFANIAWS